MSALEHRDFAEENRGRLLLKLYPERPRPARKQRAVSHLEVVALRGETRVVDDVPRRLGARDAVREELAAYASGEATSSAGVLRGIPVVGGAAGVMPQTQPELAQTDLWCDCGRTKKPWFATCDPCRRTGR